MSNPDKLSFTIPEACQATGLGRTMIYRLIQEGKLRALKAGRRTLIAAHDLAALIDSLPTSREAAE